MMKIDVLALFKFEMLGCIHFLPLSPLLNLDATPIPRLMNHTFSLEHDTFLNGKLEKLTKTQCDLPNYSPT